MHCGGRRCVSFTRGEANPLHGRSMDLLTCSLDRAYVLTKGAVSQPANLYLITYCGGAITCLRNGSKWRDCGELG